MEATNLIKDFIQAFEIDDATNAIYDVENYIKSLQYQLTQNQFDALTSFIFSTGEDYFDNSDVKLSIEENRMLDAAHLIGETFLIGDENEIIKSVKLRKIREKHIFLDEPLNDKIPILREINIPSINKLEGGIPHSTYIGYIHN